MSAACVRNCSFSSWYESFKKHTIKSRILALPEDVVNYLNADGIVLPQSSSSSHGVNSRTGTDWDSDDEDLKEDWDQDEKQPSKSYIKAPNFPQFDAQIRSAIAALGGSVFPKLNWSSPKDASWIALNNSLECKTPSDIYLLLKSSTFVAHDLTNPFHTEPSDSSDIEASANVSYELILRRWHNLNAGGEFRCFVKCRHIIAICQRHYKNFFDHIKEEEQDIVEEICEFYSTVIEDNFPESNYVFDVYRKEKGKLYVLDFNPYLRVTDGLMFSWDDLDQMDPNVSKPEFRYVQSDTGITSNPYQSCAVPQDFIDLSTGMDPNKLLDFLQMKIQNQEEETTTDDEEEDTTTDHADHSPSQTVSSVAESNEHIV